MTRLRRPAVLVLVCVCASVALTPAAQSRTVPSRLTDAAFWTMVQQLSEEGGSFPSNNFVSNETEFQTVIPRLAATVKPGGVYVGVGPDQNFTYIAALRPSIAFIVDIRRQNAMHHLLYKALMELSPTRADFIARLFARPRPPNLDVNAPPLAIFDAIVDVLPDPELWTKHLVEVFDRLERHHKFTLTPADRMMIQFVYEAFATRGPEISYSSAPVAATYFFGSDRIIRTTPYPTFAALMTTTDSAGMNRAYLASEAHYKIIRDMQLRNLIVPVVGDFAGPKAVRGVGAWAAAHKSKVTAFYTSNVEQYLFQNGVWKDYYDNVAAMPLDDSSTFIRAHFVSSGVLVERILSREMVPRTDPFFNPQFRGVSRSVSLLCSIRELLTGVSEARVSSYTDVILMSN